MKRTSAIVFLPLLLALTGCTTQTQWTSEAKALASRDAFNSTVNALATAIEAGKFDDDEARHVLTSARLGAQLLDRIDATVEQGLSASELIQQFNQVLRELNGYRQSTNPGVDPGAGDGTATQGEAHDRTD